MKPTDLTNAPPPPTGIPFPNASINKTYSELVNTTQSYLLSKVASGQLALQILDLLFKAPESSGAPALSSPVLAERLLSELKVQSAATLSPHEISKALLPSEAKQEARLLPTRRDRHEESKTEERNEKSLETVVSKAEAKPPQHRAAPDPWPALEVEEQKLLPLPGRKKMEVFLCPHPHRKHYAKNMCNNCYHRLGRNRKAWECPHADRPHYAKGKCQNCYLNEYHKVSYPPA